MRHTNTLNFWSEAKVMTLENQAQNLLDLIEKLMKQASIIALIHPWVVKFHQNELEKQRLAFFHNQPDTVPDFYGSEEYMTYIQLAREIHNARVKLETIQALMEKNLREDMDLTPLEGFMERTMSLAGV